MVPRHASRPGPRSALIAHPGAELYGSDRVMLETVSALTDAGWRVLVALPGPGPLHDEVRARGGRAVVLDVPVLRKSALRPAGLLRLVADSVVATGRILRLLRAAGPSVLYVSTLTQPLWLVVGRLARLPLVCHVHEAERGVPRPVRLGLALPLLLADRVVANSRFSLDVLTADLPALAARSSVVYNGVPGPATVTAPRERVDGGLRVVYVGRLSPRKGVDVAVAALAELAAEGPDWRLELVGSVFPGYEWYEQDLRRQVEDAGLGERVTFTGFTRSVWDRLAAGDVAVVPSRVDEPFGNTAIEAVLAARPVVASRSGGLPEAVHDVASATLVAPDDAGALAGALRDVQRRWSTVRSAAVADAGAAASRYAPASYRRQVEALLRDVVADRRRPGRSRRAGRRLRGR